MNQILAKKLIIITKWGGKIEFTHITKIRAEGKILIIEGETDDVDGSRCNVTQHYNPNDLHISFIEWYIPPL